MSIYFKNMPVSIDGVGYYAESVDFSESIGIEEFSALGTKQSYYFPSTKPEGSVNVSFYITSANEITNIQNQYSETSFTNLSIGPFTLANSLLSSFSIAGDSQSLIKGSVSYTYYGQMQKGATPSHTNAEIKPAHGAASTASMQNFGYSDLLNFDYNFSQSFDVQYQIGGSTPSKVIFNEGTIELQIEGLISDVDFTKTNLTGVNALCDGSAAEEGFYQREGQINLKNLCQNSVGAINVDGFVQERSMSVEPGGEVVERVKITEKYVADKGCDE